MLYGLPNIIMSNISSEFFKHPYLGKMLYYTDKKYEDNDILNEPKISWSKLINKNFFVGRRIPIVLQETGSFLALRVYDYRPINKNNMYYVIVDIDIIVHKDCQLTIHGSRDVCMLAMVHEALNRDFNNSIGEGDIINTYDIRDIDPEYTGYTVKIEVEGFTPKIEW